MSYQFPPTDLQSLKRELRVGIDMVMLKLNRLEQVIRILSNEAEPDDEFPFGEDTDIFYFAEDLRDIADAVEAQDR